jgi:four helix bundle protein
MGEYSLGPFNQRLSEKIDTFVHSVYDTTGLFPREELFGAVSQLRRSALSVALNFTEGYARCSRNELHRFLKISYGSLKEALYLVRFAHARKWIGFDNHQKIQDLGDEISRMLWSIFSHK